MRTHNNLYQQIASFQNLLRASRLAQRGKRFRASTASFNFHLEKELWRLHALLCLKKYRPGKYRQFKIYEPKERMISAAPYHDRVVHHALHNLLEPIFEPTFIFDSYATRKGKGTHAAIARFQQFAQQKKYVLKCDIQKYFPSINHTVLLGLLKRKIACHDTLWLIQEILASSLNSTQLNSTQLNSTHDVGIPIGNLTSQFFANVYLNGFDHFVKERLKCRYYLRYMDDFVIFHDDKKILWTVKEQIEVYLSSLKIKLHENKCRIFQTQQGISFLGLIIFPERRRLQRPNVLRCKKRLQKLQQLHQHHPEKWLQIQQSIRAWIGHAQHANSMQLRKLLLDDCVFTTKGD